MILNVGQIVYQFENEAKTCLLTLASGDSLRRWDWMWQSWNSPTERNKATFNIQNLSSKFQQFQRLCR